MKIAIHHRENSFSNHWINYCIKNKIDYKLVNCYNNDIISQLDDCDSLMWQYHHHIASDMIVAKKLFPTLSHIGMVTFPNNKTGWHFDDKVSQKYLLESIKAPLINSYAFYNKQDASDWVNSTDFPKVFKLKGGAGALNVKLIKSKEEALGLIQVAFGKGFKNFDGFYNFKEKLSKYKSKIIDLKTLFKSFGRIFIYPKYAKELPRERGYIYFQEFIRNNNCDYRVIVIDQKAIAIKRMVRKNDFRASGSGNFIFERENFKDDILKIAFDVTKRLELQSCAFDFVYDTNNKPLIVEISYGFASSGYEKCPGYWDSDLNFHKEKIDPYGWMVKSVIQSIHENRLSKKN